MTHPATLRTDALANRERLIRAAHAVFAERGLAAEMKEIAERAGLGVGTIYRNFATKDELLDAMIDSIVAEVLAAAAAIPHTAPPVQRLESFLAIAWEHAEKDRALIKALMTESDRREPPFEILATIAAIFEDGQRDGSIRSEFSPPLLAGYVAGHFQTYLLLRRGFSGEEVRRSLTTLCLRAVLA